MVRTNFFLASVLALLAGCNQTVERPLHLAERPADAVAESQLSVSADAIRADVFFLSSQRLEGRGVGTQGLDIASDYIATRFRALGLKPLPGMKDYFQPFDMTYSQSADPSTKLASGEKKLVLGRDFTAATFSPNKDFSGDVVFAGYGISDKERQYDDYANLDVKDKIVLALRYEPHDEKGQSRWAGNDFTPNSSLETKAKVAFERGAKAVVIVNPPNWHHQGDDPFFTRFSGAGAQIPLLQVKKPVAEEWLKRGSTTSLAEIQERIDKSVKPVTAELKGVSVSGNVKINRMQTAVRNVMAYIPGSGPKADEFVVIGAHYDHLGRGAQGGSLANIARMLQGGATQPSTRPAAGQIHHGADDNASGTAALLELARIISKGPAPARSLVFVAFTAEESGLMGSGYFVRNSPIDLKKTAVMLNLDMVGRVRANRILIGGHGTAEPLDAIMKKIDDRSPLQFVDNGKGGLGPSDHMSFALAKVPVIFLFSNVHPDYHMPTDTADKINFDGIEQVVTASMPMVGEFTKMPLSKYIDAADMRSMRGGQGGPTREGIRRASLGVIPKYGGEEDGKGVPIGGATEGTAAAQAGLVDGDVIVGLGKHTIGTLAELSAALAAYKPGDQVKLKYLRQGKAMDADVTLGERRQ